MKTTQLSLAAFNVISEKLNDVTVAIADLGDTVNQVPLNNQDLYGAKASKGIPDPKFASQQDMEDLRGNVYQNIDYLHKALADLHDKHDKTKWEMHDKMYACMAKHMKDNFHLPAITSAEQMSRVVKNLGLDSEFSVKPRNIYASDGSIEKLVLEWTPKQS